MERLKALHKLLKNDMKPVSLMDPKIIKFMSQQGLEGSGMIKLLQRLANLYNGHAYRDIALPKNVKFGKILNKNIINLVDKMDIRGDNFMRFLIEADHLDDIGETDYGKYDIERWSIKKVGCLNDYKLQVGAVRTWFTRSCRKKWFSADEIRF